jgi:hypothetical protein
MALQSDAEGSSVYDPQLASSAFEIVFPPLPNAVPTPTFYIDEGLTARVSISFLANPAPRDDQVAWHVVRQSSNASEALSAGSASGRFEAEEVTVEGTRVTATLLIHQASFEDVLNFCYLEASNTLGRFEYNFALALRPVATPPPMVEQGGDDGDEGGLGIGAIVGISVGCLLLICAVIILLCFLSKQKLLCFAPNNKPSGAVASDHYMSDAQRDNQTQNDQLLASGTYRSADGRDGSVDEEIGRVSGGGGRTNGASTRATSYLLANNQISRDS